RDVLLIRGLRDLRNVPTRPPLTRQNPQNGLFKTGTPAAVPPQSSGSVSIMGVGGCVGMFRRVGIIAAAVCAALAQADAEGAAPEGDTAPQRGPTAAPSTSPTQGPLS